MFSLYYGFKFRVIEIFFFLWFVFSLNSIEDIKDKVNRDSEGWVRPLHLL